MNSVQNSNSRDGLSQTGKVRKKTGCNSGWCREQPKKKNSFGRTSFRHKCEKSAELQNINIPALMLWGADDGVVPAPVADYVYDNLGTDASMKRVVKLEECGHGPQSEKPVEFYNEISDFIETYK